MENPPSSRPHVYVVGGGFGGLATARALARAPVNVTLYTAVGCPFCNTMITDGVKDLGKESTVKVMDLAEIVADSLK